MMNITDLEIKNAGASSELCDEVTASFYFQPTWVLSRAPNPLSWQSPREWKQRAESFMQEETGESSLCAIRKKVSAFNERYDRPACVRRVENQQSLTISSTWPGWYSAIDTISIALGSPEPQWRDGCWWSVCGHYPLQWVSSPADVAKLRVPDWGSMDVIRRMLENRERWQSQCPEELPARLADILDLIVPGQGLVKAVCYPSFVDMGIYLMGMTHFLTILGGEPLTADAFMDYCFELSTSYVEFLLAVKPQSFSGLFGFGGDATCMLSPEIYNRYGAAWDSRLFKYVCQRFELPDDMHCNLHSCGPSSHLYECWGKHPLRRNIAMMQTRLICGKMEKLREALPSTLLQLTLHPPHFDIIRAKPEQVKELLWSTAQDTDRRNVHFLIYAIIHGIDEIEEVERKIQLCDDVISEIRRLKSN